VSMTSRWSSSTISPSIEDSPSIGRRPRRTTSGGIGANSPFGPMAAMKESGSFATTAARTASRSSDFIICSSAIRLYIGGTART
jgi:hypothetical protein